MNRLISLLFVLISHCLLGQPDNLILTQQQNENWISEIKKAPTERQLDLLRSRILSDTNVFVPTSASDRIRIGDESHNGKKQESFCRPLLILSGKCDNNYLDISNRTDTKSIQLLASYLTIDKIERIVIHTDNKAMAIYGSRAAAGVFVLVARKKSTCKDISQIDFGPW